MGGGSGWSEVSVVVVWCVGIGFKTIFSSKLKWSIMTFNIIQHCSFQSVGSQSLDSCEN